jgi:cytochrome d ubiquinol oxidase subunit I
LLSAWTGDGSGYQVAKTQPMKLAAMEGYYEGRRCRTGGCGFTQPDKEKYNDGKDPFIFRVEIPQMLSLLAKRS